jgi:hypothetical protein
MDRRNRRMRPQKCPDELNIGSTKFDAWRFNINQSATVDPYTGSKQ